MEPSLLEIENAIRAASAKGDKELVKKLGVHWDKIKSDQQGSSIGSALANSVDVLQKTIGGGIREAGELFNEAQGYAQGKIENWTGLKPAEETGLITSKLLKTGDALIDAGDKQKAFNEAQIIERDYKTPEYAKGSFRETLFDSNKPISELSVNDLHWRNAFNWLGRRSAENAASGGLYLGGAALTAVTAPVSMPLSVALGATTFGVAGLANIGEVAIEADETLEGGGNTLTNVSFGLLNTLLDRFGAKGVIPSSKLRKMSFEQVTKALKKAKKFAALKAINKAIFREAGTEGFQEANVMLNTYVQGNSYDKQEVLDRIVDGMVLGGTMGGTIQTTVQTGNKIGSGAKWVGNGFQSPKELTEIELRTAGAYARRLQDIINKEARAGNKIDVKNVKPTAPRGARAIIDKSHRQLTNEGKKLIKALKAELNSEEASEIDVTMAKVAWDDAKTKTKGTVFESEFEALERLVGHTEKGQELINVMRELNQMTEVHNSGLKGGLSSFTDLFLPFSNDPTYQVSSAMMKTLGAAATIGNVATLGMGGLATQLGVGAGGRVLDNLSGRRSRVAKYIKDNQQLPGFKPVSGEKTIAEQKEAAKEKQKIQLDEERKENYQNGIAPGLKKDTARSIMWEHAGYIKGKEGEKRIVDTRDTKELDEEIIELINEASALNPALREAAESYIKNTPLGKRPAKTVNMDPLWDAVAEVVKRRNQSEPTVQTEIGGGFQAGGVTTNTSSGYNRGIQDNKMFVGDLQQRANKDTSLSLQDKGQILTALDTMSRNLGSDPMTTSQQIHDRLLANDVNTQAVGMYIKPYVDRIANQQNTAPQLQQPVNETIEAPIIDQSIESGPALAPLGNVNITNQDADNNNSNAAELRRLANIQKFGYDPNEVQTVPILETPVEDNNAGILDYQGTHTPSGPKHENPVRLDDMTKSINGEEAGYPSDFYGKDGMKFYAPGPRSIDDDFGIANKQSYDAIKKAKGNPDAEVTIYRAVPNQENINKINEGDWVTLSKKYAELHSRNSNDPDEDGKVLTKKVKVKDLYFAGDDVNEFGYFPVASILAITAAMIAHGSDDEDYYSKIGKYQETIGALTPSPAALSGMMI